MKIEHGSVRFHHIHLHVDHIDRMKKVLAKVATVREVNRFFVDAKEILHLDFNGINLLLAPVSEQWSPGIDHIGVTTHELDCITHELVSEGWKIVDDQTGNKRRTRFLESPEGIVIELLERKK